MEGFLDKRSDSLLKGFQRRYFVRMNSDMLYFAQKGDQNPRGSFSLLNIQDVQPAEIEKTDRRFDVMLLTTTTASSGNQSKSQRIMQMRADSKVERDAWIDAITVWIGASKWQKDAISIPKRMFTGSLACLDYCFQNGCKVEGLFRVPGSAHSINEIYQYVCLYGEEYFTRGLIRSSFNVFDISSALKKLMREFPEPILTFEYAEGFVQAKDADEVKLLVAKIPKRNQLILYRLTMLCTKLVEFNKKTSMTPQSLAVCLGPCIVPMTKTLAYVNCTPFFEILIHNQKQIFEDVNFESVEESPHPRTGSAEIGNEDKIELSEVLHKDSHSLTSPKASSQGNQIMKSITLDLGGSSQQFADEDLELSCSREDALHQKQLQKKRPSNGSLSSKSNSKFNGVDSLTAEDMHSPQSKSLSNGIPGRIMRNARRLVSHNSGSAPSSKSGSKPRKQIPDLETFEEQKKENGGDGKVGSPRKPLPVDPRTPSSENSKEQVALGLPRAMKPRLSDSDLELSGMSTEKSKGEKGLKSYGAGGNEPSRSSSGSPHRQEEIKVAAETFKNSLQFFQNLQNSGSLPDSESSTVNVAAKMKPIPAITVPAALHRTPAIGNLELPVARISRQNQQAMRQIEEVKTKLKEKDYDAVATLILSIERIQKDIDQQLSQYVEKKTLD